VGKSRDVYKQYADILSDIKYWEKCYYRAQRKLDAARNRLKEMQEPALKEEIK